MMLEADPERFTSSLKGKRVVIAITASISIYRIPDIIRDLRREGAEVIAGLSREARGMVSSEVFRWATGNEVVTEITGDIEHITLFESQETILLVCPASYNFIGKAASGISDDVPSLFFSFALGHGNPVVVSPVMHEGMMVNPINQRNIGILEEVGVSIIPPRIEAEKAKISESDKIIDYISRATGKKKLKGQKLLVIGGRGEEKIDPVRKITNSGTGYTANWILRNAFRLGADKLTFIGNSLTDIPGYVEQRKAHSFEEFSKETGETLKQGQFDIVINVASLPDFRVENQSATKIDSSLPLELKLSPVNKLNKLIRQSHRGIFVVFKLEEIFDANKTKENFAGIDPQIVVFNPYTGKGPFGAVKNKYVLLKEGKVTELGEMTKPEMTLSLLENITELNR